VNFQNQFSFIKHESLDKTIHKSLKKTGIGGMITSQKKEIRFNLNNDHFENWQRIAISTVKSNTSIKKEINRNSSNSYTVHKWTIAIR
jgi:hypothetical protein